MKKPFDKLSTNLGHNNPPVRCLGDEKRALTKEKWSLRLVVNETILQEPVLWLQ